MSINASPEVIEQLKNEMTKVISDIEEIKNDVNSGLNNLASGWNDSKAEEFKNIMNDLVKLMEKPKEVLERTEPKLDQLKAALESYNNVKF